MLLDDHHYLFAVPTPFVAVALLCLLPRLLLLLLPLSASISVISAQVCTRLLVASPTTVSDMVSYYGSSSGAGASGNPGDGPGSASPFFGALRPSAKRSPPRRARPHIADVPLSSDFRPSCASKVPFQWSSTFSGTARYQISTLW